MVLVGNKVDLEGEPGGRQVAKDAGQKLAQEFKIPFVETSAKKRIKVEAAFHDLVREVRKHQSSMMSAPKKGKDGKCALL